MARSDDQSRYDDPTGGTGPRDAFPAPDQGSDNLLPPGEAGPEPSPDPIARNPKDVGQPGETVQAPAVRRRREASVPPAGAALLPSLGGGFQPHPQPAPSATDLLVSVLRFKGTILIVWILVSAPIIAAIWTQIVPKYEARAEIRVRPIIPRLVFRTEENGPVSGYDSFVNTQVALIRGPTVRNVLDDRDRNGISETEWFKDRRKTLAERLRGWASLPEERLRDNLTVRARPRTEIIDVSFLAPSREDARIIITALVNQYLTDFKDATGKDERAINAQLEAQYKKLQDDITGQEIIRAGYYAKLQTDNPQGLIASQRVRLDEQQARLKELEIKINLLKKVSTDSNDASAISAEGEKKRPEYSEDEEWRRLNLEVKRLQHQMANSGRKPNHPGWGRDANDLKFAETLLEERQAQLDKQWQERLRNLAAGPAMAALGNSPAAAGPAASVEYELARAIEERKFLDGEVTRQAEAFNKLLDDAQNFEAANNLLRQKRELSDAVRQRKEQKDIEKDVSRTIEINGLPYSPTRPASDRRVVFTVMALMAGLGVGGGAGFLRAGRNQTIYAPRDMPHLARAPLLGYMPLVHLSKPLGKALAEEIEQKQALLIESVRVLRTALLARLDGHGHTTVVVTSANEGTGKSSFTTVLGKSIAQAGRKVLMIDADFHKMGLSKRLDLAGKPGFRESLRDKTADGLHVFPTETAGLDIMPAGLRGQGDLVFDEIAKDVFKRWIGQLFEQHGYDIVLLDTPPLLPVADAAILAGQADATILVEREHVSRRAEVASALLRLGSAGGHLLGTVFVGSSEHDQYGYGHGYSYYGGKTGGS